MSVERTLLAGVASVLTAAGAVGKLPDGPRTLLRSLGWDLPPGVDDIGLASLDIGDVGQRLTAWTDLAADPEADEGDQAAALAELALSVGRAIVDLSAVELDGPPGLPRQDGDRRRLPPPAPRAVPPPVGGRRLPAGLRHRRPARAVRAPTRAGRPVAVPGRPPAPHRALGPDGDDGHRAVRPDARRLRLGHTGIRRHRSRGEPRRGPAAHRRRRAPARAGRTPPEAAARRGTTGPPADDAALPAARRLRRGRLLRGGADRVRPAAHGRRRRGRRARRRPVCARHG